MTRLQLARHVEHARRPPPSRGSLLMLALGLGALVASMVVGAIGMGWLG